MARRPFLGKVRRGMERLVFEGSSFVVGGFRVHIMSNSALRSPDLHCAKRLTMTIPDARLASLASPEVLARARKIKLFLMDVDGTLTDGGVCLISSVAAGSGEPPV